MGLLPVFGSQAQGPGGSWGPRLACPHGVMVDWAYGVIDMLESRRAEGWDPHLAPVLGSGCTGRTLD